MAAPLMELDQHILEQLRARLPDWVQRIETREALDPEGESVLVLFLVVDANAAVFEDAEALSKARDAVFDVFEDQQVGLWPYVRFVSETEWPRSARA